MLLLEHKLGTCNCTHIKHDQHCIKALALYYNINTTVNVLVELVLHMYNKKPNFHASNEMFYSSAAMI